MGTTANASFTLDEIVVYSTSTNISGNSASAEIELSPVTVEATEISGMLCGTDITLSPITVEIKSYDSTTNYSNVSFELSPILVRSNASFIITKIFNTFVMNVKNSAISSYEGYNFNSMCKFGDMYLAATNSKIYQLGGMLDDSGSIEFVLFIDVGDIGVDKLKRVDSIVINMKSDGIYEVFVAMNEDEEYGYQFRDDIWKLHPYRRKVGKAIGRNVKIKLINKSGSKIEIDTLDAIIETLSRMV
jgi:hypothetical protein